MKDFESLHQRELNLDQAYKLNDERLQVEKTKLETL
jgi:hypothetical protein